VADDEDYIRESIKDYLEEFDFVVEAAEDGYNAIELAKSISFSLCILDIRMPGMNGIETYLEIRKISPDIKVLFFTGSRDEYVLSELRKYNMSQNNIIYKPVESLDIIRDKVESMLENA
jgi:CheY-like chemotaxis protein